MHLTCFENLWAESARSRSSANINNSLSAKEKEGVRAPTSPNALRGDYHIIWGTSQDNSNQEVVLSEEHSNQDQTVTPAQALLKDASEHCVSNAKPPGSYTAKPPGNDARSQRRWSEYRASESQNHHVAPGRITWLSSDPFFLPAQQGLEKTLGGEAVVEPLPNRPDTLSPDQAPINAPCPDFCNTLPNSPVHEAAKQTHHSLRGEDKREMHEREPPKKDRCAPVTPATTCRATGTPQPHSVLSQRKEECGARECGAECAPSEGARESAARQGQSVCGPPSAPSHIPFSLTSSTPNHQHQEK
jgi:hypothetical protein